MLPSNAVVPSRGEIWWVNFNSPITAPTPPTPTPQAQLPTTGDEIYKTRPAVVINIPASWNLQLVIVVPITSWQNRFQANNYFWMVKILADATNQLPNDSAANTFQVKSVSSQRFTQKIGVLTTQQMDLIAATIAFCIGYNPPKPPPASPKVIASASAHHHRKTTSASESLAKFKHLFPYAMSHRRANREG